MEKDYFIKKAQVVRMAGNLNRLGIRIEYFKGENFYLHFELVFSAVDVLRACGVKLIEHEGEEISQSVLKAVVSNFPRYIAAWGALNYKPFPIRYAKHMLPEQRRAYFEKEAA